MTSEAAYAAGLFEGEGSISGTAGHGRSRLLVLSMTDREPLERWCACVGRGHLLGPYARKGRRHKPYYTVALGKHEDITAVVHLMWDWLSPRRRAQIKDVLGDDLYYLERFRTCRQGHPRTAENTYVSPSGSRECKVCRLRKQRKRHGRPVDRKNAAGGWTPAG